MSTNLATIAHELVNMCRVGRNDEFIEKYYSPDVVSVESSGSPEMPAEQHGIEAVKNKNQWWTENNEVHSASVNGPFMNDGNQFAVEFLFDTTFKPTGVRSVMREMALYTVGNGKIMHEHFFYNA